MMYHNNIPWKVHDLKSKHPDHLLDLPRSDDGYYLDYNGNKISFNGNRDLRPEFVNLPLNEYHLDEIKKCSEDMYYFIFNYCKVLTGKGLQIPELRSYQEDFLLNYLKNDRMLLLAGRQTGKTTSSGLAYTWAINFHEFTKIGISANIYKGAVEVLDKIRNIFVELPIWLQQGVTKWNVQSIQLENHSRIETSATNGDAFRGFSFVGSDYSGLYIDECAFVDNWQAFSDSVLPTVSSSPNAKIVITSTPNGMNHWYDLVKGAREGTNEYYVQEVPWDCVPGRDEEWKQKIISSYSLQYFEQNYGCNFLGSSYTLIESNALGRLDAGAAIEETSEFTIYEKPIKGKKYIVLIDLASGSGEDFSVAQVIKMNKNKFRQVAVFRSKTTNTLEIPMVLLNIAKQYNDAFMLFEINYGAEVPQRIYYDFEYENLLTLAIKDGKQKLLGFKGRFALGFRMDKATKPLALTGLKALIESGRLQLSDYNTIQEFFHFVKVGTSFQAETGFHDDTVMSLALLGWLVTQDTFKEMSDYDFVKDYEDSRAENLFEMLPTSMFGDGEGFKELNMVIDQRDFL